MAIVKVGYFGGSFDPPHYGHIQMASLAIKKLSLDLLYVCPTGAPLGVKKKLANPRSTRLKMAQLAFNNNPKIKVIETEMLDKHSYTFNTLSKLLSENKGITEMFLIKGSDAFEKIINWKNYKNLFEIAQIVVFQRNKLNNKNLNNFDFDIPKNVIFFSDNIPQVSSTEIRTMLAHGEPVDLYVPTAVVKILLS